MIAALEAPVQEICIDQPSAILKELQARVSASRLQLFLQCKLRWWFKYVAQIPKPPTGSMHAGSTAHAVLKAWSRSRWNREPFSIEKLRAVFDADWAGLQEGFRIDWQGEEEEERASVWRTLEHYWSSTPLREEGIEGVEVAVEADLSQHGLPLLVGVMDLVLKPGRIVDYKLTGKSPDPQQIPHVHELQMTVYSLLYRNATGQTESGLELHHLIRAKRQPKLVVSVLAPATEQQHTRLFRQMEAYQGALDRQDQFVPSPGFHCAGCEYFNECRRWT